ncbi:MAG: hypothetical protein ACK4F5_12985 [Aliihoeflea sp.]
MRIQKAILAAILAVMVPAASAALAQSRPDARTMSCAQAQAFIQNSGAVVLTTGRHTFDRYVADSSYCSWPDTSVPATIQTRDGMCTVFRCGRPLFERN